MRLGSLARPGSGRLAFINQVPLIDDAEPVR
jgi:hypothetical protein